MWVLFAFGSAFFAGLTAILAKCGIRNTDSNVATALRTIVVLLFSWIMVFVVGAQDGLGSISPSTMLFLVLSGLSTGASWLCYFRALQLGNVNQVTPIDKSSTILTMILAFLFLRESITWIKLAAMIVIGVGTYLMIQKKEMEPSAAPQTVQEENAATRCAVEQGETASGIVLTAAEPAATETNDAEPDAMAPGDTPQEGLVQDGTAQTATPQKTKGRRWLYYALGSALFASLTSILGKIGIQDINSNLGTAIRTVVVLVMAWIVVFASGKQHTIKAIDGKSWLFLILSGIATGASWLCYYHALQTGPASVVVPIDKLSILVTVAFSALVFHEKLHAKAAVGLAMIVAGTLALLL